MNRCAPSLFALVCALALPLAGALVALAPAAASAQTVQRNFPKTALRGKITFGVPPVIGLNGKAQALATGYRIHGMDNLLVMSAQMINNTYTVDYTVDLNGQVYEIWLLSPSEVAKSPWPATAQQAAAWTFDPIAQTWTKP
jgi:hypothetical protein